MPDADSGNSSVSISSLVVEAISRLIGYQADPGPAPPKGAPLRRSVSKSRIRCSGRRGTNARVDSYAAILVQFRPCSHREPFRQQPSPHSVSLWQCSEPPPDFVQSDAATSTNPCMSRPYPFAFPLLGARPLASRESSRPR